MWDLQRKKSEYRVVKPSEGFYLPPGITSALLTFCVPTCYSSNTGYPSTKPYWWQWRGHLFRTETIVRHSCVLWPHSPTSSDSGCLQTFNKMRDWNGPCETLKFSGYHVSHLLGARKLSSLLTGSVSLNLESKWTQNKTQSNAVAVWNSLK